MLTLSRYFRAAQYIGKSSCVQGKGLAAKLESQLPAERKPVRHPELLEKVAFSLMQPNWDAQKAELLFHAYACPWLQALVKACAGEQ